MDEQKQAEYIKYPVFFHRFKMHFFAVFATAISMLGSFYAVETWHGKLIFSVIFIVLAVYFCIDLTHKECPEEKAAERLAVWLNNSDGEAEQNRSERS